MSRFLWFTVYIGHGRLCLTVPSHSATLLHGCRWNLGELQGVSSPLVVHYWVDLQMVHGFWCYDNIVPNVKFQRVTVFVLVLRLILKVIHPLQFARPLKCGFAYRSPAADKLSTDREHLTVPVRQLW